MKIISTGGDWVNNYNGDEWITFNHYDGRKKIIKKEKWSNYDIALTAKWGYFEIYPPIEINSFSDTDDKILTQINEMTKDCEWFC